MTAAGDIARDDEPAISEAEKIACWINKVAREISTATSAAVDRHDLTATEANMLMRMRDGLTSPSDIARCLGVESSNLSRLIRRLETKRLLTREVDDRNRSRAIVRLTDAGRRKAAEVRPDKRAFEERLVAALTPVEAATLRGLLERISLAVTTREPD